MGENGETRRRDVIVGPNGRLHHIDSTENDAGGTFRSHTYVPAPAEILEGWEKPTPSTELAVAVEGIKLTDAVTLSYVAFARFASAQHCSYDEELQRFEVACQDQEVAMYAAQVFESMAVAAEWRKWTVHRIWHS